MRPAARDGEIAWISTVSRLSPPVRVRSDYKQSSRAQATGIHTDRWRSVKERIPEATTTGEIPVCRARRAGEPAVRRQQLRGACGLTRACQRVRAEVSESTSATECRHRRLLLLAALREGEDGYAAEVLPGVHVEEEGAVRASRNKPPPRLIEGSTTKRVYIHG